MAKCLQANKLHKKSNWLWNYVRRLALSPPLKQCQAVCNKCAKAAVHNCKWAANKFVAYILFMAAAATVKCHVVVVWGRMFVVFVFCVHFVVSACCYCCCWWWWRDYDKPNTCLYVHHSTFAQIKKGHHKKQLNWTEIFNFPFSLCALCSFVFELCKPAKQIKLFIVD